MHRIAWTLPLVFGCSGPIAESSEYETTGQELRRQANLPASIANGFREDVGEMEAPFVEACPDSQWIGYILEGEAVCPRPVACRNAPLAPGEECRPFDDGNWHYAPLVPRADERANNNLRRYCIYTWERTQGPRDMLPPIERLPDDPRVRLERDCEVTSPASAEFDVPTSVALELQRAHDEQAGLVGDRLPFVPLDRVRVAVVDTAADNQGTPIPDPNPDISDNGHGDAVGTLVRRSSCVGGACWAIVRSELALGRRGPRDPQQPGLIDWVPDLGGDFGSQGDAARAMFNAVKRFQDEDDERHLILNLSIGWDAAYGGHKKSQLRVPARMALDVAKYAACEGALLVAAAGNRDGFSDKEHALAPAAFERKRNRCVQDPNAYAPVVHAVQGVDPRDRLLFNARRKAIPRMLAPAQFVMTATGNLSGATSTIRTHTGSSMAAAAVSGAAALVWAARPELQAHEVMDIVYANGEPLGPNARFGMGGQKQPRMRLSTCDAFIAACTGAVGQCGLTPEELAAGCGPRRARRVDASPFWKFVADEMLNFWGNPGLVVPPAPPAVPVVAVPQTLEPWATPQPGIPGCPLCGIIGELLIGQVVPPKGVTSFAQAKVHVDVKNTAQCGDFSFEAPSILNNQPFKLDLQVAAGCVLKGAGVELYLQSGKLYGTASEMYITAP